MAGYATHAYGGRLETYGGVPAGGRLAPAGAVIAQGFVNPELDAPVNCTGIVKKNGWACSNVATAEVDGKPCCAGHKRSFEKESGKGR